MSMEINGLGPNLGPPQQGQNNVEQHQEAAVAKKEAQPSQSEVQAEISEQKLQQRVQELQKMSQSYNRRLKYTINKELNQVVVKVIDPDTDKVIKELPSAELQRLHLRFREFLGTLFDEEV
jgi:flagellar protein FlaG